MKDRYVSIWFCYLKTDWFASRNQQLLGKAFVCYRFSHGRMIITAANKEANEKGIYTGFVLADAKAILPDLITMEDQPEIFDKVIQKIAEWFIRYSPVVATDPPDGIMINATGCAHLWETEEKYLSDISHRLKTMGYTVRVAMAGTIGTAWAMCRYGDERLVENGNEIHALSRLPSVSLRISDEANERLLKLGLDRVKDFFSMPISVLRRRFGNDFIKRLRQALGYESEILYPIIPIQPFYERLYCIDPIVTRSGIELALMKLLDKICEQLHKEQKGIRSVQMKMFRVDGHEQVIDIGTNKPTSNAPHLFKLFEIKLQTIVPGLGIELFTMEVTKTDDLLPVQENIWRPDMNLDDSTLTLLLDRVSNKIGESAVSRYLPLAHYWPERSFKKADSLSETTGIQWTKNKIRPLRILADPEPVSVAAPVPDYPPMLFRHKGKIHKIIKADGPERIEQEWWIAEGLYRDYYHVEDEQGNRYWLFRSGQYENGNNVSWFLHGYCA